MCTTDHLTITSNTNHHPEQGVCRDFLRNVCTRREKCKFQHVIPNVQFCHDFQNTQTCPRKHCKYIHGTYEDEQHYLATGTLPNHLKPVCLNFLKNKCTWTKCKFLHPTTNGVNSSSDTDVNGSNEEVGLGDDKISQTTNNETNELTVVESQPNGNRPYQNFPSIEDEFNRPESEQSQNNQEQNILYCLGVEPKRSKNAIKLAEVKAMQELLSQENEFLKMRLQEMQGHLAELQSCNKYLVEENHRLRQEATMHMPHSASMAIAVPHSGTNVAALTMPHSATNVTALAVPHSASVTALAVPHSSSMAIAVPHSASVTALAVPHSGTSVAALAVPHSATNVTALAVPHSSSMTLAVPHSGSVTALAVPHSSSMTSMTLTVPHSGSSVTALAVPQSSSMTALAVPAVTITNTKQQVVGGTTFAAVPVSIAMTAGTPVSITTGTPVSIATVSMAPVQMPPVVSVPASLEQTSVIYPILTQMCTK